MYLGGEQYEAERRRIAKLLAINELWSDVWELTGVRRRFDDNLAMFRSHFDKDIGWVPNWICPADFFMWMEKPVTLNPRQIIDSSRLPMMFSGYQSLGRDAVSVVMKRVPVKQRSNTWERLYDAMCSAPEEPAPPISGMGNKDTSATTRLVSTLARIGQGGFRDALMTIWERSCAVTSLTCPELLRASHVKPWSHSSRRERLDPNNGLLLAAHLDALFDKEPNIIR